MKRAGSLLAVLILAAPVAAAAQGHGGVGGFGLAVGGINRSGITGGWSHPGGSHAGVHGFAHAGFPDSGFGHGHGFNHRNFDRHIHFDDRFVAWGWGWPYWGPWQDCAYDQDGCGPYRMDDYGYTDPPAPPPCGRSSHAGYDEWSTAGCDASDPPPARRVSFGENECSDWVWRPHLHHSVCKRLARAEG